MARTHDTSGEVRRRNPKGASVTPGAALKKASTTSQALPARPKPPSASSKPPASRVPVKKPDPQPSNLPSTGDEEKQAKPGFFEKLREEVQTLWENDNYDASIAAFSSRWGFTLKTPFTIPYIINERTTVSVNLSLFWYYPKFYSKVLLFIILPKIVNYFLAFPLKIINFLLSPVYLFWNFFRDVFLTRTASVEDKFNALTNHLATLVQEPNNGLSLRVVPNLLGWYARKYFSVVMGFSSYVAVLNKLGMLNKIVTFVSSWLGISAGVDIFRYIPEVVTQYGLTFRAIMQSANYQVVENFFPTWIYSVPGQVESWSIWCNSSDTNALSAWPLYVVFKLFSTVYNFFSLFPSIFSFVPWTLCAGIDFVANRILNVWTGIRLLNSDYSSADIRSYDALYHLCAKAWGLIFPFIKGGVTNFIAPTRDPLCRADISSLTESDNTKLVELNANKACDGLATSIGSFLEQTNKFKQGAITRILETISKLSIASSSSQSYYVCLYALLIGGGVGYLTKQAHQFKPDSAPESSVLLWKAFVKVSPYMIDLTGAVLGFVLFCTFGVDTNVAVSTLELGLLFLGFIGGRYADTMSNMELSIDSVIRPILGCCSRH